MEFLENLTLGLRKRPEIIIKGEKGQFDQVFQTGDVNKVIQYLLGLISQNSELALEITKIDKRVKGLAQNERLGIESYQYLENERAKIGDELLKIFEKIEESH